MSIAPWLLTFLLNQSTLNDNSNVVGFHISVQNFAILAYSFEVVLLAFYYSALITDIYILQIYCQLSYPWSSCCYLQSYTCLIIVNLLSFKSKEFICAAKFDIAISTACPGLDYIVVETTTTAQACVDLLRQKKLGVATFLILVIFLHQLLIYWVKVSLGGSKMGWYHWLNSMFIHAWK